MPTIEQVLAKKLHEGKGFTDIEIYVKPESPETKLVVEGDDLVLYVDEPPLEGRANAALVRYLTRILGIPRQRIRIVHGLRSRLKVVRIEDMSYDQVYEKLLAHLKGAAP
ncbi:MAG: DUF167 domain-containing protein [Crenarchaeota archaeon]|nr:DUF167 domain-containing protein [Thermoproteota archaeon]